MADLATFGKRITARANAIEPNVDRLLRKVALAVDTTVVPATPVDTGRARANWQVGLGEAPSGTKYLPPEKPGSPVAGMQEALEEGARVIEGYKSSSGSIHITNNLPYIRNLNDGTSSQAPAGFVEQAVMSGVKVIQDIGDLTEVIVGDL